MPYLPLFNKQAQSMRLRSFSNPILKDKPSTILLCFLFSSFLDSFLYFFFLSLPFLLVIPHASHLQERSPTSIGLLFLPSCLNICLWSLKLKSGHVPKNLNSALKLKTTTQTIKLGLRRWNQESFLNESNRTRNWFFYQSFGKKVECTIILTPKTIGNRKRDCAWGGSGW